MIGYAEFAQVLSMLVVGQYVLLLAISVRRSRLRRPPEAVTFVTSARFLEGPVLTVLLLAAISTAAAADVIGTAAYPAVAGFTVAMIRGALFILGCWLLAWYWRQRATWR